MKFEYMSLQRVLRILAALREVSDDLSKCYLTRSQISDDLLERHIPAAVLTLAATHELAGLIEVRKYPGAAGITTYWHLTPAGHYFLTTGHLSRMKALPIVYEEPESASKLRLARGRRERNRLRRERQIARNRRKGIDPEVYSEVIPDAESYGNDLRRLPVAQRIAILRSRTGENQQIQKDRENADNAKAAPVAPLTRADIERLRQQRGIQ